MPPHTAQIHHCIGRNPLQDLDVVARLVVNPRSGIRPTERSGERDAQRLGLVSQSKSVARPQKKYLKPLLQPQTLGGEPDPFRCLHSLAVVAGNVSFFCLVALPDMAEWSWLSLPDEVWHLVFRYLRGEGVLEGPIQATCKRFRRLMVATDPQQPQLCFAPANRCAD